MQKAKSTSKLVLETVFALKKEIDSHPLQRKSIPQLLTDLHIGRNILERNFKDITGRTIIRYQLEKRMEAACTLLKEGDMNIQQCAIRCGYRDQANFTVDFKNIYEQSPSEWLRNHLEYN
ncbi:MAG: AraC family transcriptional regulator [Chitinophagaceae bacterium]